MVGCYDTAFAFEPIKVAFIFIIQLLKTHDT